MGEAPTANGEITGEQKQPKRRTARNREILLGPLSETQRQSEAKARNDEWTRLPNEDPEATQNSRGTSRFAGIAKGKFYAVLPPVPAGGPVNLNAPRPGRR